MTKAEERLVELKVYLRQELDGDKCQPYIDDLKLSIDMLEKQIVKNEPAYTMVKT